MITHSLGLDYYGLSDEGFMGLINDVPNLFYSSVWIMSRWSRPGLTEHRTQHVNRDVTTSCILPPPILVSNCVALWRRLSSFCQISLCGDISTIRRISNTYLISNIKPHPKLFDVS